MADTLTATDLFSQSHQALVSDFKLRVSVYGLLIEDHKILLQQNTVNNKYSLPGGAIEIGESQSDALAREFLEETGYSIKSGKIIDTDFNLFTFDNNFYHNIILYYAVSKLDVDIVPISSTEGDSADAQFFDLKTLDFNIVQPVFHKILKQYQWNH